MGVKDARARQESGKGETADEAVAALGAPKAKEDPVKKAKRFADYAERRKAVTKELIDKGHFVDSDGKRWLAHMGETRAEAADRIAKETAKPKVKAVKAELDQLKPEPGS